MKKILATILASSLALGTWGDASEPVVNSVQATNSLGAIKIEGNAATNMYVAVPFEGFDSDGANRKATDAVPATLAAGAKMYAYDKTQDRYNVYETENGAWKAANKMNVNADGSSDSEEADPDFAVAAGTGVILQRSGVNVNEAVYVYGQIPGAAQSAEFGAGRTLASPPYASETVEVDGAKYVNLNAFKWTVGKATSANRLGDRAGADYIQFRNTDGKLAKYYYNGTRWGVVPSQMKHFEKLVAADRALIPVGVAFWYYSNSGASVTWVTE